MVSEGFVNIGPNRGIWGNNLGAYTETAVSVNKYGAHCTITGNSSASPMFARSINFTPFKKIIIDWFFDRSDYRTSVSIALYKTTLTRTNVRNAYSHRLKSINTGGLWSSSGSLELDVSQINEHAYIAFSGGFDAPEGEYPNGTYTINNIRFLT